MDTTSKPDPNNTKPVTSRAGLKLGRGGYRSPVNHRAVHHRGQPQNGEEFVFDSYGYSSDDSSSMD